MQLGMIGLGRMGGNMTLRLMRGRHEVVAYDRNPESVSAAEKEGAEPAALPGRARHETRAAASCLDHGPVRRGRSPARSRRWSPFLESGDAIIDGGNSNYRDSIKRAEQLRKAQLDFVDCGTSGGIWGLENGYCLMIGGEPRRLRAHGAHLRDSRAR